MNRATNRTRVLTAVVTYLPEPYPRLLATAEDANRLEPTWQAWHQHLQAIKQMALAQGLDLFEITVDLDALERYCQKHRLTNTSSTRGQYAAHVLSEQHQQRAPLHPSSSLKRRSRKTKSRSR
ncbi:MAG: hypothetical protein J2P36_33320 [Ktedonobacteraceae bacterium]|nr:hypothetical protein [Ktedonobacteraceae bacterium]